MRISDAVLRQRFEMTREALAAGLPWPTVVAISAGLLWFWRARRDGAP